MEKTIFARFARRGPHFPALPHGPPKALGGPAKEQEQTINVLFDDTTLHTAKIIYSGPAILHAPEFFVHPHRVPIFVQANVIFRARTDLVTQWHHLPLIDTTVHSD